MKMGGLDLSQLRVENTGNTPNRTQVLARDNAFVIDYLYRTDGWSELMSFCSPC